MKTDTIHHCRRTSH